MLVAFDNTACGRDVQNIKSGRENFLPPYLCLVRLVINDAETPDQVLMPITSKSSTISSRTLEQELKELK